MAMNGRWVLQLRSGLVADEDEASDKTGHGWTPYPLLRSTTHATIESLIKPILEWSGYLSSLIS